MKPQFMLILFSLCFSSFLSWGQIQYTPLSSTERHELSSGFSIPKKTGQKYFLLKTLPIFLKYGLYFPEIEAVLPEPYQKTFIPGLQMGFNRLQPQKTGENYGICDTNQSPTPGCLSLWIER